MRAPRWAVATLVLALVLVVGGAATAGVASPTAELAAGQPNGTALPDHDAPVQDTETASEGMVVTELDNRTLPLRSAREGQNEIGLVPGQIFATVVNRGSERLTRPVTLHRVDPATGTAGPAVDRVNVTVDPGNRTHVRLVAPGVILDGLGEYRLRARLGSSAADGRFWIYYPEKTFFELRTVEAPTVNPGESATIRVAVRNTGLPPESEGGELRSPGRVSLTALVDGETVASTVRWLELDQTETVPLTVPATALEPGSNGVEIRSGAQHDLELDMLIEPVVVVDSPATPGGTGAGFGLALALVALLAAVLAAAARRR
jgi:hypothetical protein